METNRCMWRRREDELLVDLHGGEGVPMWRRREDELLVDLQSGEEVPSQTHPTKRGLAT